MNAVFVNTSQDWGGGERWFLWAAQAIASLGHNVVLVTAKRSCLEERAAGQSIRLCSVSSGPALPLGLGRLFRRFRPGVVLCNSGSEVRAAVLARFGSKGPAIIFRRGLCRALGTSVFHRWFYRRTDAFVCNSRATLDLVKGSAPYLSDSRIKVMYNPAPPQEPAGEDKIAGWRRRLLLKPGELLVLSVGRLAPEKGHRYLLAAFRILLRSHYASRLVIAGGGTELEALESFASDLGISERVSLLGFVAALSPLYRLADMVVQPSLPGYESFSNAALEALSHGLPIVATTAG